MSLRPWTALPFALLLCQCSPAAKPEPGPSAEALPPLSTAPYAFDLNLSLSPAALAELTRRHEEVTVAAMFYGMPAKGHEKEADEVGQIDLGRREIRLAPSQTRGRIDGGVDPNRLPLIEGEPRLLINVYSARLSNEDNLLDCGIFDGTLGEARVRPVTIACKLIDGD